MVIVSSPAVTGDVGHVITSVIEDIGNLRVLSQESFLRIRLLGLYGDITIATQFDRWRPAWGSSWAYRLFQQHHRQLNILYWSHVGAKRHSFQSTGAFKKEDHASVLFTLPNTDNANLDISLGSGLTTIHSSITG